MTELRLLSGDKMETVVILMPDVWNLVPTAEEWAKLQEERGVRTLTFLLVNHIWKHQQNFLCIYWILFVFCFLFFYQESPLPDVPSLVVQPTAGFTLSAVSLSALLEPRMSQSRDAFEVCIHTSAIKTRSQSRSCLAKSPATSWFFHFFNNAGIICQIKARKFIFPVLGILNK